MKKILYSDSQIFSNCIISFFSSFFVSFFLFSLLILYVKDWNNSYIYLFTCKSYSLIYLWLICAWRSVYHENNKIYYICFYYLLFSSFFFLFFLFLLCFVPSNFVYKELSWTLTYLFVNLILSFLHYYWRGILSQEQ